ncbi:MAG TPA: ferritin-like domain-containing protein, partial [Anaerolineaceae bacterium]|nr:ferritin-like domain-containing protein [Anaerolineaceae bacterium]
KFVHYVVETGGELAIPVIPAPTYTFKMVEEAVQKSVDWEWEVTRRINSLMDIAREEKDYLAQGFLQWFVDEQLEEVTHMENLLRVVKQAGEKNLIMLEAYLSHE